jgi:hypothetical protein
MDQKFKDSSNYVRCAYRKAWICFDIDNGHARNNIATGKGYLWVFPTRREAREHRKWQHANPNHARLSPPIKVQVPREIH